MARPTVSFNGYDLATYVTGLLMAATNPFRYPSRKLNTAQIAGRNKSALTSAWFTERKLNVVCEIGRNTRELFDESVDQLYAILQGKEKALVISYGSSTRQFTATVSNIGISDVMGGHGVLDIEFSLADPFGQAVASNTLSNTVRSGASSTENIVVEGTAEKQQPIITITISALTGGTAKYVKVGNPATSQEITISRDYTAGDVIVINENAVNPVTVNGNPVDFTGAIPSWAPGAGTVSYEDNLTTRTRTFNMIQYKRYA